MHRCIFLSVYLLLFSLSKCFSFVAQLVENLKCGAQFQELLGQMIAAAKMAGRQQGFVEGQTWVRENRSDSSHELYGKDCAAALEAKLGEFMTYLLKWSSFSRTRLMRLILSW